MTPQRKLQHKLQDYENYAKIKYTPEIDNTEIFTAILIKLIWYFGPFEQ